MDNRRNLGSYFLKNGIVKNKNVVGVFLKERFFSYF